MPKVVNTHHTSIPDLDKTGATLFAVLVKADVGDRYVAYLGLVKLTTNVRRNTAAYERSRAKKAERVAARGTKLAYKQCLIYFPAVKECQYG